MTAKAGPEVMDIKGESTPVVVEKVVEKPVRKPTTIAEVYRGQVSTPAGAPPCKPSGFLKNWPNGPCSNEVVSQWAKQVRDLGFEQNKDYSATAIQYFARYFWDIHGRDYDRVCEVIQQTFI